MTTTDERFAALIHDAIPYRELTVSISRSDERRLARLIEALNDDEPEVPLSPSDSCDLAVAFTICALDGLAADEQRVGVWAHSDGQTYDLPRPVRLPWRARLGYAIRAARQAWRAV
jgi:hypothetical protein